MNRRRTSLLARSATGLTAVLLLAGCSSGDSADEAAAPSSHSSSSSPALGGPALPSQAEGASRDAAQAFVGYWVETLNYATESGDTARLKTLGTKECAACNGFAATLDEIYGKGGHVESGGWALKSAVPIAGQPAKEPAFELVLKVEPQTVFRTKSSQPKKYPGGDQPARMVLTRAGDHWLVERLDI